MMLLVMTVAGALAGAGLLLIVRGALFVTSTPLHSVIEELHRPRAAVRVRRSMLDELADRASGRAARTRAADLAVCERSVSKFAQDRLVWAMFAAAVPLGVLPLITAGVLSLPIGWVAVAVVGAAAAGWLYALADLRIDAKKSRREFRHALASYLELVTILMAGGAGVETSLYDAAEIGRGRAFRQLRAALSASQARREPPWASLGALGHRLGIAELQQLEASMSLAGGGARVRSSLHAKATAMRGKDLAEIESEAQTRSETMVLPVAMMFAGFLLLIGYPALAGLSGP